MNWIYYIFGLISFPIIIALFGVFAPRHKIIRPVYVKTLDEIQNILRLFADKAKKDATLYLHCRNADLKIRITKKVYKRDDDHLEVEIRNSAGNQGHYAKIKTALDSGNIEYQESFTAKTNRPKNIKLKYSNRASLAISALTNIIDRILSTLSDRNNEAIWISDFDPVYLDLKKGHRVSP